MAGLRRLAFQAGIRELSAPMYSELRGIANDYLANIVSKSVLIMDSNKPITTKRKQSINSIIAVAPETHNRTILARHVTEALKIAGTPMYVGFKKSELPKRCALDPKTPRSELAKKKALRAAALPRGQFRVTKYQAEAGCFMLPSAPIHRTVRGIAAHTNIGHSGIRLSKEAAAIIQLATEAYLVKYLKLSTGAAAHAGRVRVFNRNIRLMQTV
jgi:histone H3/H4